MEKQNLVFEAKNYLDKKRNGLLDELKDITPAERRMERFARYIENNVPRKVLNRCKVSFSNYGRWIEAVISPRFGEQFSEHDTLLITAWGAESDKWQFDKSLSGHNGTWSHRMNRSFNRWPRTGGNYEIIFQATAEIDGCKMVKTTEVSERVVYKLDCK